MAVTGFSEKPLDFELNDKKYRYKFPSLGTVRKGTEILLKLEMIGIDVAEWSSKVSSGKIEGFAENWGEFCAAVIENPDAGLASDGLTIPEHEVIVNGFFQSAGLTTRISPANAPSSSSPTEKK